MATLAMREAERTGDPIPRDTSYVRISANPIVTRGTDRGRTRRAFRRHRDDAGPRLSRKSFRGQALAGAALIGRLLCSRRTRRGLTQSLTEAMARSRSRRTDPRRDQLQVGSCGASAADCRPTARCLIVFAGSNPKIQYIERSACFHLHIDGYRRRGRCPRSRAE
jgi:hypothetical protein